MRLTLSHNTVVQRVTGAVGTRHMSGITITADVHTAVRAQLHRQYLDEFGEDALSDRVVALTREQFIDTYAKNVEFWQHRLPDLDLDQLTCLPPSAVLAAHAICTNALSELGKRVADRKVVSAVELRVKQWEKQRAERTNR